MKSKPRLAKVTYEDITGFTDQTLEDFFLHSIPKRLTVYGLTCVDEQYVRVCFEVDESDEPNECEGTVIPAKAVVSVEWIK